MSTVTRLTLVTHAMTDAVQAARFPVDEPLNALGRRAVAALGPLPGADRADLIRVGPEARTRETAAALGLDGEPDSGLADLDCGAWAGAGMDGLPPEQLMGWLTDPDQRPHGGESIAGLLERVRAWLDAIADPPRRIVAVTHPAIVRAAVLVALHCPATSFWRLDIPPLSATTLHRRGPAWTVRLTAQQVAERAAEW
ncbi:histidine phosphatase family protein [Nocardia transvalensis]|uniref:histidine phosphatase family protein n=1 Tax=Nocardia transvalensis TaxID=37333 RepID=UPI001895660D|nr:histidine phosphatase family protein [Nocardia transvalensis]MBF6331257.1 histidine phosphatase family protein [Nocardia transvalensis]